MSFFSIHISVALVLISCLIVVCVFIDEYFFTTLLLLLVGRQPM